MTEYYAVTKFTSNQVLALFTAEEFDAIDASENAEVKKTMRRLTSRSIMIDVSVVVYLIFTLFKISTSN